MKKCATAPLYRQKWRRYKVLKKSNFTVSTFSCIMPFSKLVCWFVHRQAFGSIVWALHSIKSNWVTVKLEPPATGIPWQGVSHKSNFDRLFEFLCFPPARAGVSWRVGGWDVVCFLGSSLVQFHLDISLCSEHVGVLSVASDDENNGTTRLRHRASRALLKCCLSAEDHFQSSPNPGEYVFRTCRYRNTFFLFFSSSNDARSQKVKNKNNITSLLDNYSYQTLSVRLHVIQHACQVCAPSDSLLYIYIFLSFYSNSSPFHLCDWITRKSIGGALYIHVCNPIISINLREQVREVGVQPTMASNLDRYPRYFGRISLVLTLAYFITATFCFLTLYSVWELICSTFTGTLNQLHFILFIHLSSHFIFQFLHVVLMECACLLIRALP